MVLLEEIFGEEDIALPPEQRRDLECNPIHNKHIKVNKLSLISC